MGRGASITRGTSALTVVGILRAVADMAKDNSTSDRIMMVIVFWWQALQNCHCVGQGKSDDELIIHEDTRDPIERVCGVADCEKVRQVTRADHRISKMPTG